MKCLFSSVPLFAPQKLASRVKTHGILSSLNRVTRAVASLLLCMLKRDYSKEKKSRSLLMMKGNTLVACGLFSKLFPYMKMFFRLE